VGQQLAQARRLEQRSMMRSTSLRLRITTTRPSWLTKAVAMKSSLLDVQAIRRAAGLMKRKK
jgi:hypothetical protein